MLISFGVSWPVDIFHTLRIRQSSQKSFAFLCLIIVGYLAGIVSKIVRAHESAHGLEFVTWFYVANAILVLLDLLVSAYYRKWPGGMDPCAKTVGMKEIRV